MEYSVKALFKPEAYDEKTSKVELIQTHISYVFLTDDHVYKVKKPVDFGFLDYTTLKKRKFFCQEELRLNRRLCPDVYLEVVPINRWGSEIKIKGRGRTIEYAVKMRRLADDRIMTRLLEDDKVDAQTVGQIAKIMADFHSNAKTGRGVNRYGSVGQIRANCEQNFEQTQAFIGKTIENFDLIKERTYGFLDGNKELFEDRIKAGRIRDCHGDLRSQNIFIDDKIYIIDCIEFNKEFRCQDVASDIAYLAMDLDFYGKEGLSDILVEGYAKHSGDKDLQRLMNFYKCYRAYVLVKVNSFRFADKGMSDEERVKSKELAGRYFDLAMRYAKAI